MIKTKWLKLPFCFDTDRLQEDLNRISPAEWINHMNTQAYRKKWSCVPLYSPDGKEDSIYAFDDKATYLPTEQLSRCPYFQEVIDSFQCEKLSVRLMSLAAGDEILPHSDGASDFHSGLVRIHIPIKTDQRVLFNIDGELIHFGLGECWYMNARCTHSVQNLSDQDRIHLLIDCRRNTWIENIFSRAGFVADEPPVYGDPSINDDNALAVIHQLESQGVKHIADNIRRIYESRH